MDIQIGDIDKSELEPLAARALETEKENARLRNELGLETTVVRVYDGVGLKGGKEPCEWCISREGVYSYEDAVANGVFERHPGCGCTIEYHTSKGVQTQTDWTTNTWESRS